MLKRKLIVHSDSEEETPHKLLESSTSTSTSSSSSPSFMVQKDTDMEPILEQENGMKNENENHTETEHHLENNVIASDDSLPSLSDFTSTSTSTSTSLSSSSESNSLLLPSILPTFTTSTNQTTPAPFFAQHRPSSELSSPPLDLPSPLLDEQDEEEEEEESIVNQVNLETSLTNGYQNDDGDDDDDDDDDTSNSSFVKKESKDFYLIEELQLMDAETTSNSSCSFEDREKPIRFLDEFTLLSLDPSYTSKSSSSSSSLNFALLSQIRHEATKAVGLVSPVFVDSNDHDPTITPLAFETTELISYDVEFDEEGIPIFWIETEYAWYKLGAPSSDYLDTFVQSSITPYVTGRLLTMVLNDTDQSVTAEMIQASLEGYQVKIGSMELTFTYMHWEYVFDDLKEALMYFAPENTPLMHPVIHSFLKNKKPLKCVLANAKKLKSAKLNKPSSSSSASRRSASYASSNTTSTNKLKVNAMNHSSNEDDIKAVLTPLVNHVCDELGVYRVNTTCLGNDELNKALQQRLTPTVSSLTSLEKEPSLLKSVGDLVEWTSTLTSKKKKRGIVVHVDSKQSIAHVLLLISGQDTVLDEFAKPRTWFATYECLDVPLSRLSYTTSLTSLNEVTFLYHQDRFIHFSFPSLSKKKCPGCEHRQVPPLPSSEIRLQYTTSPFLESTSPIFDSYFVPLPIDPLTTPHVTVNQTTYYSGDFVYFIPDVPGPALYLFGQIESIQPKTNSSSSKPMSAPSQSSQEKETEVPPASKKFKSDKTTSTSTPASSSIASTASMPEVCYIYKSAKAITSSSSQRVSSTKDEDSPMEEDREDSKSSQVISAMVRVSLLGRWNALYHPNNEKYFYRRLFRTEKHMTIHSDRLVGTLVVLPSELINEMYYFHIPHHFVLDQSHPHHDPRQFVSLDQLYASKLMPSTDPSLLMELNALQPNTSPNVLLKLNECTELYHFANPSSSSSLSSSSSSSQFQKLKALDLFSGCGGLTVGFDSDIMPTCETKYAIEMNEHAAETFKTNFPTSNVFRMNCNTFLTNVLTDPTNDELPKPKDIDALYCGPPCQGFSGLNQFQKSDDSKNNLIAVALSFVELYRPQFFLLENVVGMLHYRLGGVQASKHRVEGGMKLGVLRFIVRILLELGYQVTWNMLQAGNFGVPQNRRRVFIMATLPKLLLPSWPEPTHVFQYAPSILSSASDYSKTYCKVPYALIPYTTVDCAISDLKPFEYVNPNLVMKWSDEKLESLKSNIPQLQASSSHTKLGSRGMVGYPQTDYISLPRSDFQRHLRLYVDDQGQLHYQDECYNHVTKPYNDVNLERICHIPKHPPGADHRSLPSKLAPWALSHPDSAASRHNGWKGLYGRLKLNGVFKTATTDMHPMSKTGTLLHPSQNRIVTVRETARSQGFPDRFVFKAFNKDVKEMYRQTGNAVPPLIATALNRVVLKSLFLQSQRHLSQPNGSLKEKKVIH